MERSKGLSTICKKRRQPLGSASGSPLAQNFSLLSLENKPGLSSQLQKIALSVRNNPYTLSFRKTSSLLNQSTMSPEKNLADESNIILNDHFLQQPCDSKEESDEADEARDAVGALLNVNDFISLVPGRLRKDSGFSEVTEEELKSYIPTNFDLLDDLHGVENLELSSLLGDNDLVEIQPSLGASSNGSLLTGFEGVEADGNNQVPSSCPTPVFHHQEMNAHTGMMSVQDELWRKERIKKDNHNMIERRRRFNINDRIKELGGLLPRSIDPESRQNKGNILKASVDYIKSLQDDQRKLSAISDQKKKTETDLRKVLITLNQMSSIIQSHGIQSPHLDPNELVTVKKLSMEFLTPSVSGISMSPVTTMVNSAPTSTQTAYAMTAMEELMMEETSPVSGDPMLLSAPVSPEGDDQSLDFSHFHH